MEGYYLFMLLLAIAWSILCIILFFKVWGMTNDVQKIREFLSDRIRPEQVQEEEIPVMQNEKDDTKPVRQQERQKDDTAFTWVVALIVTVILIVVFVYTSTMS